MRKGMQSCRAGKLGEGSGNHRHSCVGMPTTKTPGRCRCTKTRPQWEFSESKDDKILISDN